MSNVLCVLHVSQTQRILVALSDQFRNCTVKYTRIDESLTYLCIILVVVISKPDNVDVFPHRDTPQSTRSNCLHILLSFCAVVLSLYFPLIV